MGDATWPGAWLKAHRSFDQIPLGGVGARNLGRGGEGAPTLHVHLMCLRVSNSSTPAFCFRNERTLGPNQACNVFERMSVVVKGCAAFLPLLLIRCCLCATQCIAKQ